MTPTPPFPYDLLQAERERHAAYLALSTFSPVENTALRRRLLQLSARVWWHPFWGTRNGRASAARMALQRSVRAAEQGRPA